MDNQREKHEVDHYKPCLEEHGDDHHKPKLHLEDIGVDRKPIPRLEDHEVDHDKPQHEDHGADHHKLRFEDHGAGRQCGKPSPCHNLHPRSDFHDHDDTPPGFKNCPCCLPFRFLTEELRSKPWYDT
ncbi:hypothetical protein ACFE04_000602 [Oxalis oulophora]